jgi:hypothetical protein
MGLVLTGTKKSHLKNIGLLASLEILDELRNGVLRPYTTRTAWVLSDVLECRQFATPYLLRHLSFTGV